MFLAAEPPLVEELLNKTRRRLRFVKFCFFASFRFWVFFFSPLSQTTVSKTRSDVLRGAVGGCRAPWHREGGVGSLELGARPGQAAFSKAGCSHYAVVEVSSLFGHLEEELPLPPCLSSLPRRCLQPAATEKPAAQPPR